MSTLEPERGAGTGTLVEPTPQVSNGDGDHERFAHYVQKDKIMASALEGTPVVALCGKVWVPGRDPKKYPVCPMCKEIYESMGAGGGDKDKGKGEGRPRGGFFRRRRVCKFCAEKIDYINYKDVRILAPFLPERGKIQPRRISGTCAKHQRKLQTAIKRARQIALIPYVTE